jgi:proteasome lid subunit RPN8/RPN11
MAVKRFRRGGSDAPRDPTVTDVSSIATDTLHHRTLTATDHPRGEGFVVVYAPKAWADMEAHTASTVDVEVGGVLLGELYRDHAGPYLLVHSVVPALRAAQRATSVSFTAETWTQIHDTIERDHAGATIVGWYHTHPGFGVFLSDMDTFICKSFFDLPHHIATVIDPIAGKQGTFIWRAGKLVESSVLIEKPPAPLAGMSAKRRAWIIAIAFVVMCAAIWGLLQLADALAKPVDRPIEQVSP